MSIIATSLVPPYVSSLVKFFSSSGIEAYPVGGAVRDLLLGREINEWDIAVSCSPEMTLKLLPDSIPTGIVHGTLTVRWQGNLVEVTSFRGEGAYKDGRHPGSVVFGVSLAEDLSRRDFTINSMALDVIRGEIIDPFGGIRDLDHKVIRCVGKPFERLSEDGLRAMRAVRFATVLEFSIQPTTLNAIKPTLGVFTKVSAERVRDELMKMLKAKKPSRGIVLMRRTGLLSTVIPELIEGVGMYQNRWHKRDVFRHSLKSLDEAKGPPLLKMAALLHDIAKPRCIGGGGPDYTFYGHEKVGAELAKTIMNRLRFSGEDISTVSNLISNHMFSYSDEWKDGTVRRFISKLGPDMVPWAFELQRADILARGTHVKSSLNNIGRLRERIYALTKAEPALKVTDLAVDGKDVMKSLVIGPGPEVGRVLSALLERVLDDPSLNTREKLLILAREV